MLRIDPLHEGEFWRFGSLKARRPVHVWIGRIDEPSSLGNGAIEPIVSCVVVSMREGMPVLGHAPFWLSAMLSDPHEKMDPFEISVARFTDKYRDWRRAWNAGHSSAWEDGPAEVFYNAIGSLLESGMK